MTSPTHFIAVQHIHGPRLALRAITDRNDPDAGIVAITTDSPTRHLAPLARAVFIALGAHSSSDERLRATQHQLPLLTIALHSRRIRHLLIDNADHATAAPLTTLIGLALAADTAPWIVTRRASDHITDLLAAWPHRRQTWTQAKATLGPSPMLDVPADPTPWQQLPPLPAAEFPHFRATLRRTLDPDHFSLVDDAYATSLHAVRNEIGPDSTGEDVVAALRRRLHDATTTDHAMLLCRATTAGAFPAGFWVQVDLNRLRHRLPLEPWFHARHHDLNGLHAYRHTDHPAVAALAATGAAIDDIAQLTIGSLTAITADLPPTHVRHINAHLLTRIAAGAHRADHAFVLRDGRPTTPRRIRAILTDVATDTNGPDRRPHRPARDPNHQWARRLGITVRRLHA